MAFYIYLLHWLFFISIIFFSWRRSRGVLHPHFLFTSMICVQLVDFLVRGFDDRNLSGIPLSKVFFYQILILLTLGLLVFFTSFIRDESLEFKSRNPAINVDTGRQVIRSIFWIVVFLVGGEVFKRLSSVDWSMIEVVRQSLLPRGLRAWDLAAYSGNFLFSLATSLMPLAGISAAFLSSMSKGSTKILSILLLVLVLLILVTNGSRTPVVVTLAVGGMFWFFKQRSYIRRLLVVVVVVGSIAILVSMMYQFRSVGYEDVYANPQQDIGFKYHMDDSYYRAIYAYDHADKGIESWDPFKFFGTIVVNPIPRAIWPGKPFLDQEFYGQYKLSYVTNLFLGEVVAMTGVIYSIIFSPIIGFFLYAILYRAQRLIYKPLGVIAYLLVALYVYMCLRSLMNLTFFVYLPLFAVIVAIYLDRRQRKFA